MRLRIGEVLKLRVSDVNEMYLGKVTDAEAIRWVDVLHSK
jgi:hypothetical protein